MSEVQRRKYSQEEKKQSIFDGDLCAHIDSMYKFWLTPLTFDEGRCQKNLVQDILPIESLIGSSILFEQGQMPKHGLF